MALEIDNGHPVHLTIPACHDGIASWSESRLVFSPYAAPTATELSAFVNGQAVQLTGVSVIMRGAERGMYEARIT